MTVVLASPHAAREAEAVEPKCPPVIDPAAEPALPAVLDTLKSHNALDILVVGSPTGRGAPQPASQSSMFPHGIAPLLQAIAPGARVSVTERGSHGLPATDAVEVLRAAMQLHPYRLVIWLTGTTDAVRSDPAGDFYQALADGASAVADAGADLVLVSPQYSRFLEANADLPPYLSAMEAAGALPHAALFHRFELMRAWEEDDTLDLEHASPDKRAEVAARLHACLNRSFVQAMFGGKDPGG